MEFLVDTGADRTCVLKVPEGCGVSKKVISAIRAKGEGFKVPLIENVHVEGPNRFTTGNLLLVLGARQNLLGRDLQLLLGIGVLPEEGQMKAKILTLTNEDEDKIESEVWASESNKGKID